MLANWGRLDVVAVAALVDVLGQVVRTQDNLLSVVHLALILTRDVQFGLRLLAWVQIFLYKHSTLKYFSMSCLHYYSSSPCRYGL